MSKLAPVRKIDVMIGRPLPWPVYDRDRKLLLREGFVVETTGQIERLIEAGLFRAMDDGLMAEPSPSAKANIPESGSSAAPREAETVSKVDFRSARLQTGITIQMQRADIAPGEKINVKFIGYLEKQSIIVSHPTNLGQLSFVKDGTSYHCNAFCGKSAYLFDTSVIRSVMTPYPYLHLAYPNTVRVNLVRKSERIATDLVSTATPADTGKSITCIIRDLSISGAMIQSAQLGTGVGAALGLAFRLPIDEKPTVFELEARVCNVLPNGIGERNANRIGVEFVNVPAVVKRVLELYIYRKLVQEV